MNISPIFIPGELLPEVIIYSPIYIVKSYETCFRCGKQVDVWCLATGKLKDCGNFDPEVDEDLDSIQPCEDFFCFKQYTNVAFSFIKTNEKQNKLFLF